MPHQFNLRVYYEDTDAAGVVYYANYLKFIERARTEALIALGLSQPDLTKRFGITFVVRAVTVDYLAPARLEDKLVVTTEITELRRASMKMKQTVTCEERTITYCNVTVATIRTDGRPGRIPAEISTVLRRLITV